MAFAGAKRLSCHHYHPLGYGVHLDYAEEVYVPRDISFPHARRQAFHAFIAIGARLRYYLSLERRRSVVSPGRREAE